MKSEFVGFRCSEDFLQTVDERAASLGMTRSQYIVAVLRQDLVSGKPNLNIVGKKVAAYGGQIIDNRRASAKKKRKTS